MDAHKRRSPLAATIPGVLTPNEALLALNDRCGENVLVTVHTNAQPAPVVAFEGLLRHWQDDAYGPVAYDGEGRDPLAGLYRVARDQLNVTGLRGARRLEPDEGVRGLRFELGDDAWVRVVWT